MTSAVNSSAELEHPIGPHGRFHLGLPAGTVSIRGTDGEIARVRDTTGRSLSDRFEITSGDGYLELALRQQFGLSIEIGSRSFGAGPAPDLLVDLPRGTAINVNTASADVLGRGLTGPKHFRTASGDLTLEAIAGELDLEAVSGDTRVEADGALDVRARSISGDFRLRAPKLGRLEMNTTSGDMHIDAEMSGGGPYSIKSISGDATVVSRAGLQVEAQTITGDVSSSVAHRTETSPGRKLLVIGRPAATLTFKSVSGDLQVVEARDRAPVEKSFAETAPASSSPALGILQALERGDISVEDASRQLAALEEG